MLHFNVLQTCMHEVLGYRFSILCVPTYIMCILDLHFLHTKKNVYLCYLYVLLYVTFFFHNIKTFLLSEAFKYCVSILKKKALLGIITHSYAPLLILNVLRESVWHCISFCCIFLCNFFFWYRVFRFLLVFLKRVWGHARIEFLVNLDAKHVEKVRKFDFIPMFSYLISKPGMRKMANLFVNKQVPIL